MEIMLHVNKLGFGHDARVVQVSAVGFNFDEVLDPNEFLQRDLLIFDMVVDTPTSNDDYTDRTSIDQAVLNSWLHDKEHSAAASAIALCKRRGLPSEVFGAFNRWVKRNIGKRAQIWAHNQNELLAIHHGLTELPNWTPEQEAFVFSWMVGMGRYLACKDTQNLAGLTPYYGLHEAAVKAYGIQLAWREVAPRKGLRPEGGKISAVPGVEEQCPPSETHQTPAASGPSP